MAVRTVTVLLHANITSFRRAMADASRTSTRTAGTVRARMAATARTSATTLNRIGTQGQKTLNGIRTASVGLIAVFGAAVYAAARFERAMSGVEAVTQASSGQMAQLREAALEAGRTTQYSATQAAEGMEELAKAGISVEDIINGGLKGALDLAAAAQVDLSEAAEIAATSMVVFGLKGSDVSHVADLLAASANKSATDVHQMGLSLRMAGQVAAQTGLSIEDTVGALTLFAAEGLKGSDAGTSFKVMLQRLVPQSQEARRTMEDLGFSAYNSAGQFIGLEGVAREMRESFSKLTPEARNMAMTTIFGSDAVRAANILFKNGERGIRAYTAAVNDHGYAAAVAKTRMDNLIGDLNKLKSAIETALIESGSAANNVLRDMTQWVTGVVNAYSALPAPLQQTATLLAGIIGVLGLVGASMLLLLPRIALVRRELVAMGITAASARAAMMTLGRLGIVTATVGAIAWGVDNLTKRFDSAGPSVDRLTRSLLDFGQTGDVSGEAAKVFGTDLDDLAQAVNRVAHPGNLERTRDFLHTLTSFGVSDSHDLELARQEIEALDASLAQMVTGGAPDLAATAFNQLAARMEESGTGLDKFRSLLPQYQAAMESATTQTELGEVAQGGLGDAASMTADDLADQRTEAEKLADALNALNGVAIGAAEAEIGFEASIDNITEVLAENGHSLDVTTEKGRENKQAILDAAGAAQRYAEAVGAQTNSQAEGNRVMDETIAQLRGVLRDSGLTEQQIRDLLDVYGQLPSEVGTQVYAPGSAHAIEQLETLRDRLEAVPAGHRIDVDAPTEDVIAALEAVGYTVEHLPDHRVRITAPTDDARASISDLQGVIDRLRDRTVTITTHQRTVWTDSRGHSHQQAQADGGRVLRYADGGRVGYPDGGAVYGPGSATSDSIPAWLSDGEYVIRAAAVRRYGLGLLDRINGMRYAGGGPVGYATGGRVQTAAQRRAAREAAKRAAKRAAEERKETIGDVRGGLGDFRRSLNDSAGDIGRAARDLRGDLVKLGKEGRKLSAQTAVVTGKLRTLANERDKVSERIAQARQYGQTTRSDVLDYLGLDTGARSVGQLIAGGKQRVADAKQLRKDIADFQRRGLRDDLLQQVVEEGPGGRLAQLLRGATDKEIKQLNSLAKTGASLAKAIGMDTADALYDAGRNAGKGFLAGLKAEEAALQRQMDRLGESMVAAIKKKLKIKSPSQVARDEIGRQYGAGVALGVDDSLGDVRRAALRLSDATTAPLSGARFAGGAMGPREVADLVQRITTQVTAAGGAGDHSITVHARTADITVRDLERLQRVQEARARVRRPR